MPNGLANCQWVWHARLAFLARVAHNGRMSSPAPSPRVTAAAAAHRRAERQLERTRAELQAAILEDTAAGVRQSELVRATGYTRERIRQLAREAEARASA